jgi:site-specific DNA-methyltransferase (adenine-specific)
MKKVKLLKGDVLERLKSIESNSIDLIVTDPPYKLEMPKTSGVDDLLSKKKIKRVDEDWDKFTLDEYYNWCEEWINESFRVLKETGSIFIFGSYHNIGIINYLLQKNKYMIINDICWFKRNAVPNIACRRLTASYESILWASKNKKYTFNYSDMKNGDFPSDKIKSPGKQMRNVWDIPTAGSESFNIELNGEKIKHPTQKPIDVYKRCIMSGILKSEDSIVLDLFAGSGTAGIAANNLGYNSILIERDENYFELIKKRLTTNNIQFEII